MRWENLCHAVFSSDLAVRRGTSTVGLSLDLLFVTCLRDVKLHSVASVLPYVLVALP